MKDGVVYLYINVVILSLVYTYYSVKFRNNSVSTKLIGLYICCGIISIILYEIEYYNFKNIMLYPIIYWNILFIITLTPIVKFDKKAKIIEKKEDKKLFVIVSLFFIFFSILQIPELYSKLVENLIILVFTPEGGQNIYNEAMANSDLIGGRSFKNIPSIFTNAFSNLSILFLFYYMTQEKRNGMLTLGLLMTSLIAVLHNIVQGQRGPIQEAIFVFFISYMMMKKWIDTKVKKKLDKIGLILITIMMAPIILLTQSRFSDEVNGAYDSTIFYLGQQNLFFNNYGMDNNGIRYGDRTIPLFKQFIGIDNVPNNFMERRYKYPYNHISDEVFIGYIGDFTLDYGPILAFVILAVGSIIFNKLIRIEKNILMFHEVILVHFVACVIVLGAIKLYAFSDIGGNLQLLLYIALYLFFWINSKLKVNDDKIE